MFSRTDNHENNPSYLPDIVFITIFATTFFSSYFGVDLVAAIAGVVYLT